MSCSAFKDMTGGYVCNRCGLNWDADDEAPECKTWDELKQEKEILKEREINHNREYGRSVLVKLKEELKQ